MISPLPSGERVGRGAVPKTDQALLARAKPMRSHVTQPERGPWRAPPAKRFANAKFSRQGMIGPFVADFVARSHKPIIEIDGETPVDVVKDDKRAAWLDEQGYPVLRFADNDVMRHPEGVLTIIDDMLGTALLARAERA